MKLWISVLTVVGAAAWWMAHSLERPASLSVDRPDQPPVQIVPEDDSELWDASSRARATIDTLLEALTRKDGRTRHSQIKVRIEDGDVVEHVWLVDLRYEAGMLYGNVGNVPLELPNWRLGDPAMVDPREITDWMLIDEEGLRGGYTLRLARGRMTKVERERFDDEFLTHFGVDPEADRAP